MSTAAECWERALVIGSTRDDRPGGRGASLPTVTAALRLRNLGVKLGSDGRQEAAAAGCRGGEPYEDKG